MKKETKKAPTIRFRGFTDDWEQRKLGELATFNKGAGYSKSDLKASGTQIILYGRLYTKYETVIKQVDTFVDSRPGSVYSEGGEVIVPASGETAEDIAIASVVEKPGILLGGDLNIIHPIHNLDSTFLAISISNGEPHKEMAKRAQGKSVVHLHNDDLSQIKFRYPSIEEQSKISKFFSNLDNLITLHQRKFDQLKTAKKYFLQNMFPAKGEKVPRIRFQGFTGEWKQRKFGEIAEYKKGPFGSALKKEFFIPDSDISIKVYEQQNAINKDWTLSRYYISQEYAQKLKAFEVHSGDIIVSCAGTIGEIYELPAQSRPGIINQALMRIRVNKDIVCKDIFKLAFSNMIDSLSREFSNGSAIKNIPPFADLKPMKVLLPDKTEQKLIGDFFTDIDKTITLHQHKLNQFQTMKKFMLQNLFI